MARPKDPEKTVPVLIRVSPTAANELRRRAKEQKHSLGEVVENWLLPKEPDEEGPGSPVLKQFQRTLAHTLKDYVTKADLDAAVARATSHY